MAGRWLQTLEGCSSRHPSNGDPGQVSGARVTQPRGAQIEATSSFPVHFSRRCLVLATCLLPPNSSRLRSLLPPTVLSFRAYFRPTILGYGAVKPVPKTAVSLLCPWPSRGSPGLEGGVTWLLFRVTFWRDFKIHFLCHRCCWGCRPESESPQAVGLSLMDRFEKLRTSL